MRVVCLITIVCMIVYMQVVHDVRLCGFNRKQEHLQGTHSHHMFFPVYSLSNRKFSPSFVTITYTKLTKQTYPA